MTLNQHAAILNAYISRLTLADLRQLVAVQEVATNAGMNGNTGSQIQANRLCERIARDSLCRLLNHDRDAITRIIGLAVESAE